MKSLNIKQRLLVSFVSVIFFFGLNLGAYFWGKTKKDTQLKVLEQATQSQVTTLTLQKMIGDLKKQVSLVQQMTESAGDAEVTKMSDEEIKVFSSQVDTITKKVDSLVKLDPQNKMTAQFKNSYTELKTAWLDFYNLYGGKDHKKAMITLIMNAEPASETSLMMLDELIKSSEEKVIQAQKEFDSISHLVNQISVSLFIISLLVAVFIALAVASYISKRLASLQDGASKLRQGELEARVQVSGNDELATLGSEFNSMAESLLEARTKLEAAHKETLNLQREMEQIFDTVGQAIMTFDSDLLVNDLYSKETDRIMPGVNPTNRNINNVLFDDSDIAPILKTSVESEITLSFDNDLTQWELTDLEDAKEFAKTVGGKKRDFKVNFRPIYDSEEVVNRILCQVEDITEIKALQAEAAKSNERLERMRFVTNLGVNNYPHFHKEQKNFISQLYDFIEDANAKKFDITHIAILKRALHTGKGNSNLLRCHQLAAFYHDAEDQLKNILETYENGKAPDLSQLNEAHNKLRNELESLSHLFNEVYGEKTGDESIEIKRLSWAENILLLIKNLPGINNDIRNNIQDHIEQFQFAKSMECAGSLIKNYEIHVVRIANKIGMEFGHIKFKGFDNTLIDENLLEHINEALVHSITNSVVHGYKEENLESVIDSKIKIDIDMSVDKNENLVINIQDHGSGIDIDKVRQKALSLSDELAEEVKDYTDDQVVQLIFSPKLSTYDSENQFAGRGIGMYAAFKAIEATGGEIKVSTKWGEGTNVKLVIPKRINNKISYVTIEQSRHEDDEKTQAA